MRSNRRTELDGVRARFAAWRRGGRRRAIPDHLWRAALTLLPRYGPSAICRRLGLNSSRFKEVREAHGECVAERSRGPRHQAGGGGPATRGSGGRRSSARRRRAVSRRPAFVEWPPLGLAAGSALARPLPLDPVGVAGECRLVVDGPGGARLTVVLPRADLAVIEAVCRSVLGGPRPADPAAA
jgi:hypothetical protein